MSMPAGIVTGVIPFRLIAIVSETEGIDTLYERALRRPDIRFGLMLRDPEHRRRRVEHLAAHALRGGVPAGVTLIANSFPLPGVRYLHGTSAMLRSGVGGMRSDGEGDRNENGSRDTDASELPIVGYSVHDLAEAELAVAAGACYIMFSPIFPTPSKPGHPGAGLDALRRICGAVALPVFALGGITAANARSVLDAGAYGIASISLFASGSHDDLGPILASLCQSNIQHRTSHIS